MALPVTIKKINERTRLVCLCLNTAAAGTFVTGVIVPLTKSEAERNGFVALALTFAAAIIHGLAQFILTLVRQEQ